MTWRPDPSLVEWLSSAENPPVRYLAARDLLGPRPSSDTLAALRDQIFTWGALEAILALQGEDGSFAATGGSPEASPTFWALCLMQRCGLDASDEPVARAIEYLDLRHRSVGALSHTSGGSGVLPCYLGLATTALIKLGAFDHELVRSSIHWLVEHQRFDHRTTRAGGGEPWPFRHMTQSFLLGDYRSDLLDMLQGIADADPDLVREDWVQTAVDDMQDLTDDGRITLVKNYRKNLTDPIPFEPLGQPSRFLTYQWILIQQRFDAAVPSSA